MKPGYSRASVQPITAQVLENDMIALRYKIFGESMYYSKGVDYLVEGDTLRVYISRCPIKGPCDVMAENVLPGGTGWDAEVRLPHKAGQRIVVVHADGEQEILP